VRSTKRGHAINGDEFTLTHADTYLTVPFTTFIDVSYRGITHQVFAAADRNAFTFAHVTGTFTVGEYQGHIVETLDTVSTQVSHRYQALVTTPTGVLSVHSYDNTRTLLDLVGALGPSATQLGVTIAPNDEIEFASPPRVALQLELALIEIMPLTAEVIDLLPTWEGTQVAGGQLYGGRFGDNSAYITMVTDTCRVLAMPAAGVDPDEVADLLTSLFVTWS